MLTQTIVTVYDDKHVPRVFMYWHKQTMNNLMKSTKVQNPRRVESCELCQCACAEIGHASRCSCNAWCCQLKQGPAARLNVVDNRGCWASWVFPCGSATITVNTNTHAHRFCYEEKWRPKCMEHYGSPARSQQRSIFRENPTNFLTFVAC